MNFENKDFNKIRKIIFENGKVFEGKPFGASAELCENIFETVFSTSMTGYQEILSDPSFYGQAVCMTYPLIGNYNTNFSDNESFKFYPGAFIVSSYYENTREKDVSLDSKMKSEKIPGIFDVDTRKITRMLRNEGSMRMLITDSNISVTSAVDKIKKMTNISSHVEMVSCKQNLLFNSLEELDFFLKNKKSMEVNNYAFKNKLRIIFIDCGVKYSIIKEILKRNCEVVLVPFDTSFDKILDLRPDGLILTNGPGDPADNISVINTTKKLRGKLPIFGICLGHQILALSANVSTFKMKFGHRGANHPVKELGTDKIFMTSQNHSYSVDKNVSSSFDITHINLLDNSIEGIENKEEFCFSVQFHPEGSPGPNDNLYLFDKFIKNIKEFKISKNLK